MEMQSNFEDRYFKNARKNNERIRSYFDDDDDADDYVDPNQQISHQNTPLIESPSPEVDPLDAFM